MQIDIATKQQLAKLIARPSTVTQSDTAFLSELIVKYPYYQPLHLLLARANRDGLTNENLSKAALYNSGVLLHQVVYNAENLKTRHITLAGFIAIKADKAENKVQQSEEHSTENEQFFDKIEEVNPPLANPDWRDEQETFDEIAEVELPRQQKADTDYKQELVQDDETFEEIAEIDSSAYLTSPTVAEEKVDTPSQSAEELLPDELAIENIVATDFFAFEERFQSEQVTEDQKITDLTVTQPEEYNQEAEDQTVSKYNDDKLPYTFLWWLAKTRKEHEQIFQPYVTPKKTEATKQGELQQQYVEHIFHLQTPFNVAEEAEKSTLNKVVPHKGDEIIEKFIQNEPQIRAPKTDQINNENKAKKSAEDHYDLVSETLASIYIEQMLYHKAIDTYQKLSLKFPEKSRYFADLIQSLEKKI